MALSRGSRRSLTISGVLFVVVLLSSLFRPLCELAVAAPIGSPPNGARVLQPGQLPVVCTEADGTVNLSGATYGAYWSESAQAWISAPYCYARWGYLQASASQIVAAGATVTVTATPDDGRMAGFVAVQGGMSWSYPGTRISGCGTTDMSCTVKIGDEDAPPAEWTWHQFHVSGPGRVFILPPSYAPRCQAAAPCLDTYTNAWSYVGVTPEDNCTVSPQSALQSGSGEQGLTTLQAQACKILGLTWEMPGGKDTQYSNSWATIDGVIPAAEVQKQKFEVDLILKNGSDKMKSCPSNRSYKWAMKFAGKPAKTYKVGTSCREPVFVDQEGQYRVSVIEYNNKTGKETGRKITNQLVTVQDWLIVGMGDSNGSGQGTANEGVPYNFAQCDRGAGSYQSLAAEAIEDADDKTSVTFIHTSCSGARTVHLHGKRYVGQEVNLANPLQPQIKQLTRRLGTGKKRREVDAVILSIGINDVLFGGILETCLLNPYPEISCQNARVKLFLNPATGGEPTYRAGGDSDPTLDRYTRTWINKLPGLYKDVAKSLKAANILPKRIFITGYPEPTTDESGNICPSSFLPGIGHHDWYWLGVVGRLLGNQVAATKQSQGWTPVMEIGSNFFGHGYCAADSYFQSIPGSFYTQGNPFGTFHSKAYGHFLMSLNVKRALCKQMYGNDKCEGFPRKPQ